MSDLKDRFDYVDDRIKVLVKKYPLVFAVVLLVGAALGAIVMAIIS